MLAELSSPWWCICTTDWALRFLKVQCKNRKRLLTRLNLLCQKYKNNCCMRKKNLRVLTTLLTLGKVSCKYLSLSTITQSQNYAKIWKIKNNNPTKPQVKRVFHSLLSKHPLKHLNLNMSQEYKTVLCSPTLMSTRNASCAKISSLTSTNQGLQVLGENLTKPNARTKNAATVPWSMKKRLS